MGYTSNYLTCAGREIHYTEWGAQHGETVIAWHGLARTGRDMDEVAEHLSSRYRVICPDTIGRGLSEWSPDPVNEYQLSFYVRLATELVDQLDIDKFHWIGTSMGGAIGTLAAATTLRGRIRRLILNDNGPRLAEPALQRIRAYAGNPPTFQRVTELEQFLRKVYEPYGWLSDAQWRRMAETSARRLPDGRITTHYDPAMVQQFIHHPDDYDLWDAYDSLDIPVLCLRGEHSDLLLPETTDEMRRRGPRAVVVTIPGCGHAPALNVPDQLELVERFFTAAD
ncbi:alpha/beta hydrolase [Caldimonas thermodepolymerans]|jgi:Predicted hydrolases or acyltransferases (alpha/beta hydrolase superfamily)|uniref:Alpha/beta hydrolase n=1 Tax=Caldimonas thermodepolymerans TaxID=215580 RepID=A0A2S5T2V9_9BURK|nr:alpha/beta hydrolase [Caldimonas thermodepolymerans]PPE69331.1 alpha/beta hydrolase [Caldimonas thermodepolymerans]QPC31060.1 alpha/beta hydrolase [Caldimonas thermodepolymerans]RDH96215.1 pimeloyl-ACP methyl ester carboxylesterase [Caldimonas thermodepolymerans]TCP04135.1 pimeloyl-ACP methyl ester carboxylesterase [Caldimonas thermodepolymerans]UZG43784.1 alpha/beta hydrolase [Caldimonas thermodepolymerans]